MKQTLKGIGNELEASRKKSGKSLQGLAKRSVSLSEEDFTLAECGNLTNEAKLVLVVNSYGLSSDVLGKVLSAIKPALARRRAQIALENSDTSQKPIPFRSQVWRPRNGHQVRV